MSCTSRNTRWTSSFSTHWYSWFWSEKIFNIIPKIFISHIKGTVKTAWLSDSQFGLQNYAGNGGPQTFFFFIIEYEELKWVLCIHLSGLFNIAVCIQEVSTVFSQRWNTTFEEETRSRLGEGFTSPRVLYSAIAYCTFVNDRYLSTASFWQVKLSWTLGLMNTRTNRTILPTKQWQIFGCPIASVHTPDLPRTSVHYEKSAPSIPRSVRCRLAEERIYKSHYNDVRNIVSYIDFHVSANALVIPYMG